MTPWSTPLILDADRRPIHGSEAALCDAIRRGADLRVYTEFRHEEHIAPGSDRRELVQEVADFRVTCLIDDRWAAGIITLRQPVNIPDGFGLRPSMSFFLYNQNGEQAIARPYLDGSLAAGDPGPSPHDPPPDMPRYHVHDEWDASTNAPSRNFVYDFDTFRYHTHDVWRQAYAHDEQGRPTGGSLDQLVEAFARGAELKVAIRGLCDDLTSQPLPHEVFIHLGSCYHYTTSQLLLACSHPVVRVAPAIPLRYSSKNWDFGWLMPRTDGLIAGTIYDPYTLRPRYTQYRCAMRWFVNG